MTNDEGSPNNRMRKKLGVIPSEVEESRGKRLRLFRGILRLRFASLSMTICYSDFIIVSSFVIRHSSFAS
jgi:hypothetical protein